MDSEYRRRNSSGINQPVDSTESAAGSGDGLTMGELAREAGVTLRALRFYQSKGLLSHHRNGARVFNREDRDRLALILQGKRLGFTLNEISEMFAARARGCTRTLPIDRRRCVDQITMLEHQRRDIDQAIAELRRIYTEMFIHSGAPDSARVAKTR